MLRCATFTLFLAMTAAQVWGQSAANSGQIAGQVLDPSGAVVPGLTVTARQTGTNYTRTSVTDPEGRYAIGPLPLGAYEVKIAPTGLEPEAQQVFVSLGGRAPANFKLGLAAVHQSMEVAATGAAIEPGQTFSKSVLTDVQLRNLPSNGRRIRWMFLLTPATQIEPECGGLAISGQKGLFININVDGGDYTSTHWCGHVEFSPTFSLEALQEFQVLRSTFSAEFGRSTGGVVNLATKSGTNQVHGSAFYLFRNDDLTKRDPFGREQIGLGQQFGGSAGGPIQKDRTFFFIGGDFQNNTKPLQVLYSELDRQNIRNTAGAQALLAIAPEAELQAISQSRSVISRLDHRLTQMHTVTARFDYTRNRVTDSSGAFILSQGIGADSLTNRSVQNASPVNDRRDLGGMLQLNSVFSSRHVNELRFHVVNEYRPWDPGTGPEVTVRAGNPIQTVGIYGPQATGLSYGNIGYKFSDMRYQIVDNFSIVTGAHTMKFGFDTDRVKGDTTFNPGWNGTYRFDSLDDFLARRPAQYTQFAGTGELSALIRQTAFFVQDEWRVRPGLTISPGFRYEMATLPGYPTASVPQNRFPWATTIPDDRELIAPRLGLAWDIGNNAKTVLRAATGIFYAPPNMPLFEQAMLGNGGNPDLSSSVTINGAASVLGAFQSAGINLGTAPLGALPVLTGTQLGAVVAPENRIAGQNVYFFEPNFKLPRSIQFRGALEHEFARGVTASIDFTNINVARIDRVRNINLPLPVADATGRPIFRNVAATKPYPLYGFAYLTEASARSLYRGTTAMVTVRRNRYTLDAAYTLGWSYSYDDHERGITGANYENAFDLSREYGYSNIDERQQFAGSGMVFLPFKLQAAASARFNTGRPFSALTGTDSNGDGVVRDRPIIEGVVIKRNTFRNLGLADVDFRMQRNFTLPNEKGRLSVTAEIFNLFDNDNVEIGSAQMTYGAGPVSTNPDFGRIRSAATGAYLTSGTLRTSPFQVQLGLRLQF